MQRADEDGAANADAIGQPAHEDAARARCRSRPASPPAPATERSVPSCFLHRLHADHDQQRRAVGDRQDGQHQPGRPPRGAAVNAGFLHSTLPFLLSRTSSHGHWRRLRGHGMTGETPGGKMRWGARPRLMLATLAACAVPAAAQTWPAKPVKIVVPFGPGGPADVYARIVGQDLTERSRQQFVDREQGGRRRHHRHRRRRQGGARRLHAAR